MLRIKKNDQVMIIAGKDKGKTGKVLKVMKESNTAVVENINMVKKAQRPSEANQQGGFVEVAKPIHLSNIMLIDKKSNKPTRFGAKILKDGKKVRVSKRSGEVI